jgi:acyl dehydratase
MSIRRGLLSTMAYETVPPLQGAAMGVNYGFESLRFVAPVKCGSRIRTRFTLAEAYARPSGWIHVNYDVTIEIEGSKKPALTARWMTLVVPEQKEVEA